MGLKPKLLPADRRALLPTAILAGRGSLRSSRKRILDALKLKKVVVVAGFQGITKEFEATTLGRGGSDTTATALGVALRAVAVEIYTDVNGVMTTDPHFGSSS